MAVDVAQKTALPPALTRPSLRMGPSLAKPKHTLFGTPFEQLDEDQKEEIRHMNTYSIQLSQRRKFKDQYLLPEDMKPRLTGRKQLVNEQDKFDSQRDKTEGVRRTVDSLHLKALNFEIEKLPALAGNIDRGKTRSSWFKKEDLDHSALVNTVGLTARESYNRDRYATKPPVHQYALIGDVLKKGMDFNSRKRDILPVPASREIKMSTKDRPIDAQSASTEEDSKPILVKVSSKTGETITTPTEQSKTVSGPPKCILDLPKNIRHRFGSRMCDNLLSDRATVEKGLERYKRTNKNRNNVIHKSSDDVPTPSAEDVKLNPIYEDLGNAMRMNIFPGYSMNHKCSTTHTVYSNDVHLSRIPPPDEYRYRRDELSTWAEHNVLRQRMKRAWEVYLNDILSKSSENK